MSRRASRCECGQPKRPGEEGCDRCTFLDGKKSRVANLIGALRNLGGEATLRGLVTEMAIHPRKINEALAVAIRDGRVERIETEAEYQKNEVAFILTDACPARAEPGQLAFRRWQDFLAARAEKASRPRRLREPDPSPWEQADLLRWRERRRRGVARGQLRLVG